MSETKTTMPRSPVGTIAHRVMGAEDRLFAVLDAAKDTELAFAARDEFKLRVKMLFVGDLAEQLFHVAPHLIALDPDAEFLHRWGEHLDRHPGILLTTGAGADALWTHLRSIFIINDEDGEEYAFRFYDPRVLRPYLPTCTAEEARELFGPIRNILVAADPPTALLSYVPDATGATMTEIPLPEAEPPTETGEDDA